MDDVDANNKCSICLENLLSRQTHEQTVGAIAPCGHCFHEKCYMSWERTSLSKSKKVECPICKGRCKTFVRLFLTCTDEAQDSECDGEDEETDLDENDNEEEKSNMTDASKKNYSKVNSLRRKIRSLKQKNSLLQDLKKRNDDLNDDNKSLQKELEEERVKIIDFQNKHNKQVLLIDDLNYTLVKMERDIRDRDSQILKLKKEREMLLETDALLQKEIASLMKQNQKENMVEIEEIQRKYKKLKTEYQTLFRKQKDNEEEISCLQVEISDLTRQLTQRNLCGDDLKNHEPGSKRHLKLSHDGIETQQHKHAKVEVRPKTREDSKESRSYPAAPSSEWSQVDKRPKLKPSVVDKFFNSADNSQYNRKTTKKGRNLDLF